MRNYIALNNLEFNPDERDITFFAEDSETGEIKGVSTLMQTISFQVEPLAADNSISAQILLEKCLAIASSIVNGVDVIVDAKNEKLLSALYKCGFKVKHKNVTVLRREF